MKKLLATLIVTFLLLGTCIIAVCPASAAEGINYQDWLIFDGAVIEYVGQDTEVVIPTQDENGLPVTVIGPKAFYENKTIEKVVIPEGITDIGDEAFMRCTNLAEVSLPYSLSKAGHSSFLSAEALVELVIPGNLKEIPKDFVGNNNITNLVISYGVEVIKTDAFGMLQTAEIVIPESVYYIGACAFNSFGSNLGERLEIYITNDDCQLGINDGNDSFYFSDPEAWGKQGQFAELLTWENGGYNKVTKMHVYGLKDGNVKKYVSEFMSDSANKPWGYAVFHGISADELAEKNEWCKENGVQKPKAEDTGSNADNDGDKNGNDGKTNDKNNVNNTNPTNTTDNSLIITIIIAAAAVIIVIVIALVVVVLVMSKNKKKKKKKAKAKPAVEQAPVEETAPAENQNEE